MRSIVAGLTGLAVAAGILAGCPMDTTPRTYTVTIENLTSGQPFAPIVAATHSPALTMFRVGTFASGEIESIAEDGNPAPMVTALQNLVGVTDVYNVGRPIVAMGTNNGGFTDTATFMITAMPWDVFSMAGMLAITNDGFVGLDSVGLPVSGTTEIYALGYDAGTEDNTEASEDLGDPASVLGPVALDGDPNGNEDAAVDTDPAEPVDLHPGIQGIADLSPELHGWPEPVARVTITAN